MKDYLGANQLTQILRVFLCVLLLQASNAWAQAKTAANMGGSTTQAGVVVAANGGGVSTANAQEMLQHFVMQRVVMDESPLFKALAVNGPLQALYSELCPFNDSNFQWRANQIKAKNAEILKQIAAAYINAQQNGFPNLIVDILPILVRGEKGFDTKVSLPFATFIATELANNGVNNVRLDHMPVGPAGKNQRGEMQDKPLSDSPQQPLVTSPKAS
jgi:4-amino-4-deoxy-L-arabinose transferase-like glycosyltransferase